MGGHQVRLGSALFKRKNAFSSFCEALFCSRISFITDFFFLTAYEFPCLPKQVAWILATNKVFMYPELLPVCSLKAKNPQDKILFTKAEDK